MTELTSLELSDCVALGSMFVVNSDDTSSTGESECDAAGLLIKLTLHAMRGT